MVSAESLLWSRVIDAKENHDIMIMDVLSAFAQYNMLESVNGK